MNRTFTKFNTLLICLIIGLNAFAQDTVQVGTTLNFNTGNQYPSPYGNANSGAVHQFLYLASELQALGMTSGNIEDLQFYVAFNNGTTLTDFEIQIKSTTTTNLTTFETGLTSLYGPQNFTDADGWNNHDLGSGFQWDGTSNILIQTCFWNGSNTFNSLMCYTATSFNSVVYRGSNFASPCANLWFPTSSVNRPTLKFIYQPDTLPPTANFYSTDTVSCTSTVSFVNTTQEAFPTTYLWDFGDGNTDTARNPTHTYAQDSLWDVRLIATNQYGSDTLLLIDYMNINTSASLTPASCVAVTKNYCCGFGITNVTINTLTNPSPDGSDGYKDYSCTKTTQLQEGQTYTLTVVADTPSNHNVKAWIDWNDDGVFNPSTEEVFSSLNKVVHSQSITIPSGTVQNQYIRMRIAADYAVQPIPTPCDSIENGQAEDYGVLILPNTTPPTAEFEVDDTLTCSGAVTFTDLSSFAPGSWHWDFGDGDTDTVQHPIHTYTVDGYYTVRLIATNAYGTDTMTKTNYVHVDLGATPKAANCIPNTISYCCDYGIFNVTFEDINFSSGNGSEGYLDLTCGQSTDLVEGSNHNLSITTSGSNAQDTRAYIDYDNDGSFSANEEVLSEDNAFNASATVSIPAGATLNTPLRFRVISDYAGALPNSCTDPLYGQAEDFTVTIIPNTVPPQAAFSADDTVKCTATVQFSDSSKYAPTSWEWDFGDGNTDTVQHPSHTYAAIGTYTVKLKVCNSFGCDSITKTNYIDVVGLLGGPVAASCYPVTTNYCCGIGIYNVTLQSINNTTANGGSDSYQDYSCANSTNLTEGQNYSMTVTTGPNFNEHLLVWIDFDNDGSFSNATELVLQSMNTLTNHSGTVSIPTGATLSTPLRMRVLSDRAGGGPPPNNACQDPRFGQVEDYAVVILGNTQPPIAQFGAADLNVCNGFVSFLDSSLNVPATWHWDFGDGDTSILQNPTHEYTSTGSFTVKLIVTNQYGADTLEMVNYININSLSGPRPANCEPTIASFQFQMGFRNFTLDTINYNSGASGQDGGNVDETCTQKTTLKDGQTYNWSAVTNANFPETVKGWIDYNDDGDFAVGEEILWSDSVQTNHSGSFKVTAQGVYNTELRIRVASDFGGTNDPTACGTLVYGQAEDFTVVIKPNIAPPLGDFNADNEFTCDGFVQFNDVSLNGPTSWFWSFGDGDTSHAKNPAHTYTSPGTYDVILVVTNQYGTDTVTKLNYITYSAGPNSTNCVSNTTQLQGFFRTGILVFDFEQIYQTSGTSIQDSGYVDFSCSAQTFATEGNTYNVNITTGNQVAENVRIWIDINGDDTLTHPAELVFSSDSVLTNHSGTISIPFGTVTDQPLRLRVSTDVPQMPDPLPCDDVAFGQAEDYTVIVLGNESPPISIFEGKKIDPCQGTCTFRDQSAGNPTSWDWDFGDNKGTSTLQNPFYTYDEPGTYLVTLIAQNQWGADTIQHILDVPFVTARFDKSADSIGIGHKVFFTNRSKGDNLKYYWDFDDGNDSTSQHPSHIYSVTGNYIVTMIATDSLRGCNAVWTEPMTVLEFIPGILEQSELLLAVYPNPASDHFVIQSKNGSLTEARVSLYSMDGQLAQIRINNNGSDKLSIDTRDLSSGLYIIEVVTDDDRWLQKIVIDR